MGADLYWFEKEKKKVNGSNAIAAMNAIIDIIDNDEPNKNEKINKVVSDYIKDRW